MEVRLCAQLGATLWSEAYCPYCPYCPKGVIPARLCRRLKQRILEQGRCLVRNALGPTLACIGQVLRASLYLASILLVRAHGPSQLQQFYPAALA